MARMGMKAICRYICGVFILLFVSGTLITYAPGAETFMIFHQVIAGGGAISAAAAANWLNRLPETHWVHQSRPLSITFLVIAMIATALMVSAG